MTEAPGYTIDPLELLARLAPRKRRRLALYALGPAASAPSPGFLAAVCAELGWDPRRPDFFGQDIELDAILAAFTVAASPEASVFEDRSGRMEMDGFKIDAFLAFRAKAASAAESAPPDETPAVDVVLIHARNAGKWTARRTKRLSERLRRVFGDDGRALGGARPHFLAVGGERPGLEATVAWPLWMRGRSGAAHWLPFEERPQGEVAVLRCDRHYRPHRGGAYWKLE